MNKSAGGENGSGPSRSTAAAGMNKLPLAGRLSRDRAVIPLDHIFLRQREGGLGPEGGA
jgi:hypothetical protein